MKKRQTKFQMLFTPLSIMAQLRTRMDQHKMKYNIDPKRIYVTPEQFSEYQEICGLISRNSFLRNKGRLYFRGAEVIAI